MDIPPGYHFTPSNEELIIQYLLKKAKGESLPSDAIVERDLYGSKSPWEVLNDDDHWETICGDESKKCIYVFTCLKLLCKSGHGTRKARTAGCGSWHGETGSKPIFDQVTGAQIGKREMFVFISNNKKLKKVKRPHWIMHEFSLADSILDSIKERSINNYVVCKITIDESKHLKVESRPQNTKKKTPMKRKTPLPNHPHKSNQCDQELYHNDPTSSCLTSPFNQESNLLNEEFDQINNRVEEEDTFVPEDMINIDELLAILDEDESLEEPPRINESLAGYIDGLESLIKINDDQEMEQYNENSSQVHAEQQQRSPRKRTRVFYQEDQIINKKIREEEEDDWFIL